ncbi:GroES-like protein [Aureobasidium pullulans]|uniref:GroES-like protein n=1 Tax=Aureobasidium pullulans TaxID=5580 RepID=A0AB74JK88_AURPU|nr:GroES-like protein [Aureobasidium pullulans]THX48693.1 GroES-like protein [Aureobasidium pullulans]THX89795.1 GroES-like protein [Aureobasidium pullulans]THY59131.1 GroES-like protein [Aureobasidium pullulans]TIA57265.1 GroES-like protein [Aureobasidium pullulans]
MAEALRKVDSAVASRSSKIGTMKALRIHGKEDLRLEDIQTPQCGDGQIMIKPAWCGICGTDLHEYMGGPSLCPTTPHPITNETVPLTIGHEFSGVIEELGQGVSNKYAVGQRVVVQPIIYCGECGSCKDGIPNCCDKNGFVGLSGWGGGLAEHIVVPEYCVVPVPDNVSLELAALVEPLAVAWHAVNMSPVKEFKKGQFALILGGGPIGLSVIQALKAHGDGTIIVSEVSTKRKAFAEDFGADYILDPTKDDIPKRCKEICGGIRGVDCVFDAAGVQAGLDAAVLAMRARGTLVNIAIWEKDARIIPNQFVFREKTYKGVATYVLGDFDEVLQAISSGRMKPEKMITKKVELKDVIEEGFLTLLADKDNHVKVLIKSNNIE